MRLLKNIGLVVVSLLLTRCASNEVELYNGPSQIHFVEETGSMIVNDSNPIFSIEVGVSKPVDYKRTFDVVIDTESSSAIEGQSFELLNSQVLVEAGKTMATIDVQGLFDGSEPSGVLLKLKLSSENKDEVAQFKNSFELELFKFCEFNRDAFIGTYHVYEHANNGEFEYDVTITEGDDPYSVFISGLWDVPDSSVKLIFDRKETSCNIPAQFFFDDPQIGYENVWIRSLSAGTYNACIGTIENLEYFIYPGDTPDKGWDRGTFDMYKIN